MSTIFSSWAHDSINCFLLIECPQLRDTSLKKRFHHERMYWLLILRTFWISIKCYDFFSVSLLPIHWIIVHNQGWIITFWTWFRCWTSFAAISFTRMSAFQKIATNFLTMFGFPSTANTGMSAFLAAGLTPIVRASYATLFLATRLTRVFAFWFTFFMRTKLYDATFPSWTRHTQITTNT